MLRASSRLKWPGGGEEPQHCGMFEDVEAFLTSRATKPRLLGLQQFPSVVLLQPLPNDFGNLSGPQKHQSIAPF